MTTLSLTLASLEETEDMARTLSLWARPGTLIALVGDLGSGKSSFARAFIRALMQPESTEDIPSPSFSLLQIYEDTRIPIFHADLYRLSTSEEQAELGFVDLLQSHCGLIEWADRLPGKLNDNTLQISFSGMGEMRLAKLEASGSWEAALARNALIATFLQTPSFALGTRAFFEGDASSRRYETVVHQAKPALLMDMPQRPDGPPVRHGKPYSAIAHLAENITSVVAINTHLVERGYSAPKILKADLQNGLAIIEPLGAAGYGKMQGAGADMREPLETAVALLADMTRHDWPWLVNAAAGFSHAVKPYDEEAQLIEVDLLPSWYFPFARGVAAAPGINEEFAEIWRKILPLSSSQNPQWVLRDYHSPNLIWIPERKGLQRVGIIDTQDALMGHAAYDLMSLIQDARVDIDPAMADHLYQHYVKLRQAQGVFSQSDFAAAYAVLGAQRATKILGIFARLHKRDGKPAYLKHMPRVSRYLAHNLQHPALAPLRDWYLEHLPQALRVGVS